MDKSMTLIPRLSEKAYGLSKASNTYVFVVPLDANKITVAAAVNAQFEVTVTAVNVIKTKGKIMRTVRGGGRRSSGKRPDIKKAYVKLKAGDSIPIFAVEDAQVVKAEKAAEKQAKADKKDKK